MISAKSSKLISGNPSFQNPKVENSWVRENMVTHSRRRTDRSTKYCKYHFLRPECGSLGQSRPCQWVETPGPPYRLAPCTYISLRLLLATNINILTIKRASVISGETKSSGTPTLQTILEIMGQPISEHVPIHPHMRHLTAG